MELSCSIGDSYGSNKFTTTNTTTHTPARNLHETKNLQGNIFPSISQYMLGDYYYEFGAMAISLHGKQRE